MLQELKRKTYCINFGNTKKESNVVFDRMSFCFSEIQKLGYTFDEEELVYRENLKKEGFELLNKNFWDLGW